MGFHIRTLLLMAFSLISFSASPVQTPDTLSGVSSELAKFRHASVSDLSYNVEFNIPEISTAPVDGQVKARFSYKPVSPQPFLPFDFKADNCQLHSVIVNGTILKPEIINEHILIPSELLKDSGNNVEMTFTSSDKGMNRRDGYVYTLYVPDRARGVFPCFDQPDMKASFSLSLSVPKTWKAVGNTYQTDETVLDQNTKKIVFAPTEPLSTYLFAFAAGDFKKVDYDKDGMRFSAYHRETDPRKVSQLDDIFSDVATSLKWQEEHTGIKYPFAKYDLVILPGFQFGGMEHTGATFYNDKSLFLPDNPTPDEYLRRSSLIAHETSHMWFGDLVTMRWFDDVWTKEVFANYYAAQITRRLLPDFDHDIEWLRDYTAAAMSEDRSDGRTSIRQNLDNLANAGLIYNNIIYNKAPVMLAKLVELMGQDAYRDGIREYLSTFSYANADWDELVGILDRHTPEDIKEFSRVWVYEKGIPLIDVRIDGDSLIVRQTDPYGKGNVWPQKFSIAIYERNQFSPVEVCLKNDSILTFPLNGISENATVIPNFDGKGYGRFTTNADNLRNLLSLLTQSDNLPDISRMSLMMTLYENYLLGNIPAEVWAETCIRRIPRETDPQLAASLVGYLAYPLRQLPDSVDFPMEQQLWQIAIDHSISSCSTAILRLLANSSRNPQVTEKLFRLWESGQSPLLSEKDFMNLAYQLSVRYPDRQPYIISTQRKRLSNPDRIAEFDFISRATDPDSAKRRELFNSLKVPANRRIEPWTASLLSLLFHPLREKEAASNIDEALRMLPDVQQHGDIFYPANWSKAVLGGLNSDESLRITKNVISSEEFDGTLLRNKIQNAVYPLSVVSRH